MVSGRVVATRRKGGWVDAEAAAADDDDDGGDADGDNDDDGEDGMCKEYLIVYIFPLTVRETTSRSETAVCMLTSQFTWWSHVTRYKSIARTTRHASHAQHVTHLAS